jgi:CRP-like cAMP-binding protein
MRIKYVVITTKVIFFEERSMDETMLAKTTLFRGLGKDELSLALQRLYAEEVRYKKEEYILYAGDKTDRLGLVTGGSVTIESNDVWGNRTILSHIGPGQFFAETYAILEREPLLVDAIANENSTVLFLYIRNLKDLAIHGEPWAMKMITNLLMISARKNLILSGRSFHTSPKTIRGKVLAYLNSVALQEGTHRFEIPFDRQQLADYLNVERSALSKELGKMKREGLILVNKNHFELLEGNDEK